MLREKARVLKKVSIGPKYAKDDALCKLLYISNL